MDEVRKLRTHFFIWKILFVIGGLLLAVISFIVGLLIGRSQGEEGGGGSIYPYCSLGLMSLYGVNSPRLFTKALLLISLSSFLVGMMSPVFGQDIDYSVYKRSKWTDQGISR